MIVVNGTRDAVEEAIRMIKRLVAERSLDYPPMLNWDQVRNATRREILRMVYLILGDVDADNMIPLYKFKQYGGMLAGDPGSFFALQQSAAWEAWATDPSTASGACANGPAMRLADLIRAFAVPAGRWPTQRRQSCGWALAGPGGQAPRRPG